MRIALVADDPRDFPLAIPGVPVAAARDYLMDPAWGAERGVQIYNLCRSYRYQSFGYYVSLLAEARGHKPLPSVSAIEDLQSPNLQRVLAAGLDEAIGRALAALRTDDFTLSIYFGHNLAARYEALARQLFDLFRAPLLQAQFARRNGGWHMRSIRPLAASDIPAAHRAFVLEAARRFFAGRRPRPRPTPRPVFDLAILRDADNPLPASNDRALARFARAARALGLRSQLIGRNDLGRLGHFDGLFIRDNTFINHYTYRFSRRAAAEGLVVIDDPDSILRCNNKVYLAELLARHGIPAPRTLVVHRRNVAGIVPALGLPCVLKQPDSSLSLGVVKAETAAELEVLVDRLLDQSDLIVAQEYLPTPFDWRVGILDGRPLFVCQYFMAPGHWQIVRHVPGQAHYEEGPTVAMAVEAAPPRVVRLALKAARLIGDGFYGVDIKQAGRRCCVIEVNDNPNVDAGHEDGVLGDALYQQVMAVFARRMAERRAPPP